MVATPPRDRTDQLATRLRRDRLLAVVRGQPLEAILATIDVLVSCEIGLIEVSLTSNDALDSIARSAGRFDDTVLIGAGTVLTLDQAASARDAGAAFLVTPAAGPSGMVELEIPAIVGAFTPTEVVHAMGLGPAAVKLFPASLGGAAYLSTLRQPFPEVPFLPVGGIDLDDAKTYLRAGAIAVGVGSPLIGDAARGGDLDALAQRARSFRAAVLEVLT